MKRYYGYKKNRIKLNGKLLAVILSFLICAGATVIYGNHLKKKAEESKKLFPDTTAAETVPDTSENTPSKNTVRAVDAVLLPREWSMSTEALRQAAALVLAVPTDSATVTLRDNDGFPLYASYISAAFQPKDTAPAAVSANELMTELHKSGIYVCGYFDSKITNDSGYLAQFIRDYEIALIGELHAAGIDEILISGLNPRAESADWVCDLLLDIRKKYPELVLGICVYADAVVSDDSSPFIPKLADSADFIALDMSNTKTESYLNLLRDATLYFSKYNMRALVPFADSDTLAQRIQALDDAAIFNRQIIKIRE